MLRKPHLFKRICAAATVLCANSVSVPDEKFIAFARDLFGSVNFRLVYPTRSSCVKKQQNLSPLHRFAIKDEFAASEKWIFPSGR
jgi:hypothetical protein